MDSLSVCDHENTATISVFALAVAFSEATDPHR